MKAKIEYDLIKEGISAGRPAIIVTLGKGKLNLNESIKKIREISEEKNCKFIFIDETDSENFQLHLIKILVNLGDEFETELLTDCTLVPNYNLRAYIKRWIVRIYKDNKFSREAFISFANNEKAYFVFEIKRNIQADGIESTVNEYNINKERVILFSESVMACNLPKICLKKGFRLSRGLNE